MNIDWPALRAAAADGGRARVRPVLAAARRRGRAGRRRARRHRLQRGERLVRADPVRRVRPGLGAARGRAAGRLVAVSVVAGDGAPLVPCGRCRQLLLEAGGPGLLLDADGGPRPLGELLPGAFTGADLADRRDERRALRRCLTPST